MLVRRIARPLLAAWFVAEGVDAARRPEAHLARTDAAWRRIGSRVELPEPPPRTRLRLLVRLHGAAMAWAALMLALGRHPRTSSLALAALTVPLAVVNQPFVGTAADRRLLQERFLRNLSMIGGALLAGVDHEGRPGIAWRARHARVDRAAAQQARAAVTAATREARALAREVRRATA